MLPCFLCQLPEQADFSEPTHDGKDLVFGFDVHWKKAGGLAIKESRITNRAKKTRLPAIRHRAVKRIFINFGLRTPEKAGWDGTFHFLGDEGLTATTSIPGRFAVRGFLLPHRADDIEELEGEGDSFEKRMVVLGLAEGGTGGEEQAEEKGFHVSVWFFLHSHPQSGHLQNATRSLITTPITRDQQVAPSSRVAFCSSVMG